MKMKQSKFSSAAIACLIALASFTACSDDDNCPENTRIANALVTVKPQGEGQTPILQLDDSTTLTPTNMSTSPFGEKEVRALCNISVTDDKTDKHNWKVTVNSIDSILTKKMAQDMGEQNDELYGSDPVEIVRDWVTVAEDGYLTLRFRTRWGDNNPHIVNLVASNSSNPYEITFHHKGNVNGPASDAIVAFKLDKLPDTTGKTVDVTLKWMSFSGEKSVTFKIGPHTSSSSAITSKVTGSTSKVQ